MEYSNIQKRLVSDLTVERAAAKKAQVEVTRLEKNIKQIVRCMHAQTIVAFCGIIISLGTK